MPFVIRDGYTTEDVFPASAYMDALKFRYRPCLPEREEDFRIAVAVAQNGKQVMAEYRKLLMEHLVGWEVQDEKGNAVSTTDVNAYVVLPRVVQRFIADCICSYGPAKAKDDVKNSAN